MAAVAVSQARDMPGRSATAAALVLLEVWLLFAADVGIAVYLIRRFWLHALRWHPRPQPGRSFGRSVC